MQDFFILTLLEYKTIQQMRPLFYLFIGILLTACTSYNDDALSESLYNSNRQIPSYFGKYQGIWTYQGKQIGTAQLELGIQQSYTYIPLLPDAKVAIMRKLGLTTLQVVPTNAYHVLYQETGYSATTIYMVALPSDFTYSFTANGKNHSIQIIIQKGNAASAYNEQNETFSSVFYIEAVKVDNSTIINYKKPQAVQFHTLKKSATGGN